MNRIHTVAAIAAVLCIACIASARIFKPRQAPVNPSLGVPLVSRIPCDGATNPEDQVSLATMFSTNGWERSFRIEVFESEYCKRGDLGFACAQPGHSLWKQIWSADSKTATAVSALGLSSCEEQGSKDAPRIVLTGWYREPAADAPHAKEPLWKQAPVKKTASRWETYEFADSSGGTASIEIVRR